jgi:hypothetical protein
LLIVYDCSLLRDKKVVNCGVFVRFRAPLQLVYNGTLKQIRIFDGTPMKKLAPNHRAKTKKRGES